MTATELLHRPWLIAASLLVAALLAYANSFPGAFILDDQLVVAQNPLVADPDLLTILRSDYWHGFSNGGLFRPLTILSLALNHKLLGAGPSGYHLVNVLLHGAVTLLFWRALQAWGLPPVMAVASALLFAVHPIHTEVVNEVVGRSELMVALFLLLAFLAASRTGPGADTVVVGCYLLALLSKEHAITFLVLLPLAIFFVAGVPTKFWEGRLRLFAGLLAVTLAWLLWREFAVIRELPPVQPSAAIVPLAHLQPLARVLTALHHQWLYLGKLLLPANLQAAYSASDLPPFITSIGTLPALLVVLATVTLLALLVLGWRRRLPLALFGLFYVFSFLPTANLLFPIGVTFAERLAYFPSLWFCAVLGIVGCGARWQIARMRVGQVLLGIVVVTCLGTTLLRNRDFASEVILWRAEVAQNPKDYLGWLYLAQSLVIEGAHADAEAAYRTLLTLDPDDPIGLRSAVAFHLFQRSYAQALPLAWRSYADAERNGDAVAMAYDARELANVYVGLGDCGQAMVFLEGPATPIRDNPKTIETRLKTLSCLGADRQVIDELSAVKPAQLTHGMQYQRAVSLLRLGQVADARTQLDALTRHAEADGDTWNLLGVACAQMQDWPAAVAAFETAVSLAPGIESFRMNLQRAQIDAGAGN